MVLYDQFSQVNSLPRGQSLVVNRSLRSKRKREGERRGTKRKGKGGGMREKQKRETSFCACYAD